MASSIPRVGQDHLFYQIFYEVVVSRIVQSMIETPDLADLSLPEYVPKICVTTQYSKFNYISQ